MIFIYHLSGIRRSILLHSILKGTDANAYSPTRRRMQSQPLRYEVLRKVEHGNMASPRSSPSALRQHHTRKSQIFCVSAQEERILCRWLRSKRNRAAYDTAKQTTSRLPLTARLQVQYPRILLLVSRVS